MRILFTKPHSTMKIANRTFRYNDSKDEVKNMKVFIIRHAIAEDSNRGGDRARALTEEGKKKMKEAAEGFARLELEIDAIYSSPLVRAVQTAEIIAKAIGYKGTIEKVEELSPGNSPKDVMD